MRQIKIVQEIQLGYHRRSTDTHVHMILDESGSMNIIQDSTISAVNEYIESLKLQDKDTKFSLVKFADYVQETVTNMPVGMVKHLDRYSYTADGGSTSLLDAVGRTLSKLQYNLDNEKHIVVVVTDGGENSSREYTTQDVFKLREKLENTGKYTFVFLGANQDSWATASTFGFASGNTMNWNSTTRGVKAMMSSLADSTMALAKGSAMNTHTMFNQDQRKIVEGTL